MKTTLHPESNEKQNSSGEFNILLLEKYVREEISKYVGKYVNVIVFSDINLVILSVTCGSITTASFISATLTPVGRRNLFITIFLTFLHFWQVMDLLNYF